MSSIRANALFYVGFIALLFPNVSAQSPSWRLVTRIIDGDTIELDNRETIRLIGIDAPEINDSHGSDTSSAKECRAFLRGLIANKKARLEFDQKTRDSFGRTLAYLFLEDGTFVNARIIQEGFGQAYAAYPFKYLQEFQNHERHARSEARGLWADKAATFAAAPHPAVAAAAANSQIQLTADSVIVYVTKTGAKYHRAGCRSLRKSAIPMALKEAAARYGPCSICRPALP